MFVFFFFFFHFSNWHYSSSFSKIISSHVIEYTGMVRLYILMAQHNTAVTPMLTHWSYCSLAPSHCCDSQLWRMPRKPPPARSHWCRWCAGCWGSPSPRYGCEATTGENTTCQNSRIPRINTGIHNQQSIRSTTGAVLIWRRQLTWGLRY